MKKNLTFSKLLMLIAIAVLPLSMMAQKVGNKKLRPAEKYWYIQADGGLSINHGDLANYEGWMFTNSDNYFPKMALRNWNGHLGFGYRFSKVFGFNIKGGYGLLSGHKHGQALVFEGDNGIYHDLALDKSNYIEANVNLTINLFNIFNYNPRRVFNLVPHIGFGGISYKAGAVNQLNNDDQVESTVAEKADKRDLTFTVPAGMEVTFNVAPKFDIFVDYTYNFTGSDKLDQVAKIASDEAKHVINDKDMYSQLNLGLRYKFNDPCDIEKMAQKKIEVRANPDPLVKGEDGNVCFDVIVTIPEEYFQKQAVLNLKPYFSYNGGQIELPEPIIFVGEKVNTNDKYDFRVNYKEGGEFTKHYCIPYQEEMASSELMGDPMFYVYDGHVYPNQDEIVKNAYFAQGATVKLADGVIAPKECKPTTNQKASVEGSTINVNWSGNADSYVVTLLKEEEVIDTKTVKGTNCSFNNFDSETSYTIKIVGICEGEELDPVFTNKITTPAVETPADFTFFFPKDSWDINKKSINNQTRVAIVDKLKEDPSIKGFKVEGWASPEGELDRNDKLADNRAKNAKTDIEKQIKKAGKKAKDFEINIHGNGPDWNKFMEEVRNSNIPDKNSILNTINNAPDREKAIKDMIAIYPVLEEEILPLLRRAEVKIIK